MTAFTDYIESIAYDCFYRFNEASTPIVEYNATYGTVTNFGCTLNQTPGPFADNGDPSPYIVIPAGASYLKMNTPSFNPTGGNSNCSVAIWVKGPYTGTDGTSRVLSGDTGGSTFYRILWNSDDSFTWTIGKGVSGSDSVTSDALADDGWHLLTFTFDSGTMYSYVDGVAGPTKAVGWTGPTLLPNSAFLFYWGTVDWTGGVCNTVMSSDATWTPAEITGMYAAGVGGPSSLPMSLSGFLTSAAASLPVRLHTVEAGAAASLALVLEAGDPSHYRGTVAAWAPQVVLDGVDISDQLVGRITIEHAENESGEATFTLLPDPGTIDLSDYERKAVAISFVGKSDLGATLYTVRRFTGITTTAVIDPDAGELTVSATTDLQGRLEQLDRAQLTQLIGGQWSAHVFDDTADGYQYALDRLSTLAQAIHVDVYGRLVLDDWAAKATADVELTDAHRFGNTLSLSRANRRDLITRVAVAVDFRFARLRHRAIELIFWDALGFCHYLNNGWRAPAKDMIRAAADGTAWTRTSDITWVELPPINPSVCNPPRAWAGGADLFCLGASWTAARRWAQTLTEEYTLTVRAPDLEESIGIQTSKADYGLEATFDATDYEAQNDFSGPPAGASYDSGLADWVLAADTTEADGRSALEAAIACALAKARVEILGRARKNRVRLANVYDPSLTLDKTIRVNTPYLLAKGKLARITETLDLVTGEPRQVLELALSRHGGAGLAVDDTLEAPTAPSAPAETPTARTVYLPYRLGATEFSAADDPDWDGYMTNVAAGSPIYDAAGEIYRDRFVVRMPEIEEAARDAVSAQAPQTYELIVPQDELTVSN
jgi:hypothetical protein